MPSDRATRASARAARKSYAESSRGSSTSLDSAFTSFDSASAAPMSSSPLTSANSSALTSPESSPEPNGSSLSKNSTLSKACSRIQHASRRDRITQTPLPPFFDVDGMQLKPTPQFNMLWYWLAERQEIYVRRQQGLPREEWTNDPIMRDFRFCNAYRVLDRESQFLIREVIQKGKQTPVEIAFRVLLYDIFTRQSTYELLQQHIGKLQWKTYNRERYSEVLRSHKGSLYTAAFQKTSSSDAATKNRPRYEAHLDDLERFMSDKLPRRIAKATHSVEVYEYFLWQRSYAHFKSYQVTVNFTYTPLLNFNANDFVVPGPGARKGLTRMFGTSLASACAKDPTAEMRALLWLTRTQQEHFERCGLEFKLLNGDRPLEVPDIEHAVCELDKYLRGGARKVYKVAEGGARLPPPVLPEAWKQKARRESNVREAWPNLVKEKSWDLEEIVGDKVEDGVTWVRVKWVGFPESKNTWERASHIRHDSRTAMVEYMKKRKGKKTMGKRKR